MKITKLFIILAFAFAAICAEQTAAQNVLSLKAVGNGEKVRLTISWKKIALNESDYQCADLKSVPKATLKALKVECN